MNKLIVLITAMIVITLAACGKGYDRDAAIKATIAKYACVRTGEFVGKDAEAVYECKGRGKYTSSEISYTAYKEHNELH